MNFDEYEQAYIQENEFLINEPTYVPYDQSTYKLNATYLHYNLRHECYREINVNYLHMTELLEDQVALEEADYILYAHSFARVDDMGWVVKQQLLEIASRRKPTAEIIVVGKACNAKQMFSAEEEPKNITYYQDFFVEKLGERFGLKLYSQFMQFDPLELHLAIWPVDGCKSKCAFCRRTYMDIPFRSVPIEKIKAALDYKAKTCPPALEIISLRAENLSEYGMDIYGEPSLYKVIELLNSYEQIRYVKFDIGLCIGELSDRDVAAICGMKAQLAYFCANLETGTDRLLKVIKKQHSVSRAVEVITKIRTAHPQAYFSTTVMVGIPTETLTDIDLLSELLVDLEADDVHLNECIISPRCPLAAYEPMSSSLVAYHTARVLNNIKHESHVRRFHERPYVMSINCHKIKPGRRIMNTIRKNYERDPLCYPRYPIQYTDVKFD